MIYFYECLLPFSNLELFGFSHNFVVFAILCRFYPEIVGKYAQYWSHIFSKYFLLLPEQLFIVKCFTSSIFTLTLVNILVTLPTSEFEPYFLKCIFSLRVICCCAHLFSYICRGAKIDPWGAPLKVDETTHEETVSLSRALRYCFTKYKRHSCVTLNRVLAVKGKWDTIKGSDSHKYYKEEFQHLVFINKYSRWKIELYWNYCIKL